MKAIRKAVLAIMQHAKRAVASLSKIAPGESTTALLEITQHMTEFGLLEQRTDFEELGSIAISAVQHLHGMKQTVAETEDWLNKLTEQLQNLQPMLQGLSPNAKWCLVDPQFFKMLP